MEGMMIQVRFDVSRLRRILPENISSSEIAELTHEMIDDLMEEGTRDDGEEMDEYEFDMGEEDASQVGGADEVDGVNSADDDSQAGGDGEKY
jgi:hypothetical protein